MKNTIGKKAEELTRMSDKFAKYNAAAVGFGSVGSSHFNHGVECAIQGVRCDINDISENGHMNQNKIEQREAGFIPIFEKGLSWTVVRWEVAEVYPKLPSLFQSALNTTGQSQEC